MKEIFCQIHDHCPVCSHRFGEFFLPFGDDDREKAKEYKINQIVRNQVHGFKKERSLKALHTYWATCNFIAQNTEHKQWGTKDKVDFQCRVGAHLVNKDLIVVKPDGEVVFHYLSIAFKNMAHIESCRYFDQAYGIMVDFWNTTHKEKISEDELIEMVKQDMASR